MTGYLGRMYVSKNYFFVSRGILALIILNNYTGKAGDEDADAAHENAIFIYASKYKLGRFLRIYFKITFIKFNKSYNNSRFLLLLLIITTQ